MFDVGGSGWARVVGLSSAAIYFETLQLGNHIASPPFMCCEQHVCKAFPLTPRVIHCQHRYVANANAYYYTVLFQCCE